jgi:hypothetical protein
MNDHDIMQANDLSKVEVHQTMEAAWADLEKTFFADLPGKQRRDAKLCFYSGVRAAVNLVILSAGLTGTVEGAVDTIVAEIVAYDKQAAGDIRAELGLN